jgi:hypothetical protein
VVTYKEHEAAARALQAMESSSFGPRKLSVRWYSPERQQQKASGVDSDVDWVSLALSALMGGAGLNCAPDCLVTASDEQFLAAAAALVAVSLSRARGGVQGAKL